MANNKDAEPVPVPHRRERPPGRLRVAASPAAKAVIVGDPVQAVVHVRLAPAASRRGARYSVRSASRPAAPAQPATVVGRHCEAGDVLATDTALPEGTRPGDLLAVACTGAYNHSMASNYNLVGRPARRRGPGRRRAPARTP